MNKCEVLGNKSTIFISYSRSLVRIRFFELVKFDPPPPPPPDRDSLKINLDAEVPLFLGKVPVVENSFISCLKLREASWANPPQTIQANKKPEGIPDTVRLHAADKYKDSIVSVETKHKHKQPQNVHLAHIYSDVRVRRLNKLFPGQLAVGAPWGTRAGAPGSDCLFIKFHLVLDLQSFCLVAPHPL